MNEPRHDWHGAGTGSSLRLNGLMALFGHCQDVVEMYDFRPTCSKVRVKEGHSPTFSAKLKVDPLVSKELAHEIHPATK